MESLTLSVKYQNTALKLIRQLKSWKVFDFSVMNDGSVHTFDIAGLSKNQLRRLKADY